MWTGEDGAACRVEGTGACWVFIKAKIGQFIYGRYPDAERWRVNLVFALAVAGLFPLMVPQIPGKASSAVYTFFIFPVIAFWLLVGGAGGVGTGLLDAAGSSSRSSASSASASSQVEQLCVADAAPRGRAQSRRRVSAGDALAVLDQRPHRSCRPCRRSCGAACW